MDLPTYTSVFAIERRLYAIYDFELPAPIGLFQAGAFIVVASIFFAFGWLVGIQFSAGTAWFYVVPPGMAAWIASKPVTEHKRPHAWLVSQARFLLEPRTLHRLTDAHEPKALYFRADVRCGRAQ